ncbi:MAG TPA: YHYH protein [Candidatus Saccharimonadales bacterium]|nr:YHYH protein [Candidatus Saccharimonadales bacterium]
MGKPSDNLGKNQNGPENLPPVETIAEAQADEALAKKVDAEMAVRPVEIPMDAPKPAEGSATEVKPVSMPSAPAIGTASEPGTPPAVHTVSHEALSLIKPKRKLGKKIAILTLGILVFAALAGAIAYWLSYDHDDPYSSGTNYGTQKSSTPKKTTTTAPKVAGLQLDTTKKYGNKYADGILPVGDGKYVADAPKTGYVYACTDYAKNLGSDPGGANARGPWFINNNQSYDSAKKLRVVGNVVWQADFTNTVSGATRTITTNGLPSHPSGVFPIRTTDPAYVYDRNPNTIKGQAFTFALAATPAYSQTPHCMSGTVGVMLTGIELNSAFDAGGRDAGAWETQDSCGGHPQSSGVYHYHTLSSCIKDTSVHTVIGYALDGYPITGPQVGTDNVLTTSDLDECHGIVSSVQVDGTSVTTYHYVMTQDFPYSVSCYRATPISPPGQPGVRP